MFAVEPMAAKALLPALGGTPTAWNVSLVTYQALLLAGYGWAHLLVRRPVRHQAIAQAVVLLVAVALLPWRGFTPDGAPRDWPAFWVMGVLLRRVALPFFVLASTGPLVQRWLAASDDRAADPTFLYGVGNAASLGALLGYPLVLERLLPLDRAAGERGLTQAGLFCGGFVLYAAVALAVAALVF